MSAIGKGVTLICGNQLDGFIDTAPAGGVAVAMAPITVNIGDVITLSHYVGRKAWQIIVTDSDGNVLPSADYLATQTLNARPAADTISIACAAANLIFISIRWEENSTEAALFPVGQLNSEGTRTSSIGTATVTIIND